MKTKPESDSLQFFDCNVILGKRADRKEGEPWSLEDLLRDMTYFGISKALVTNGKSIDFDPVIGNHELIAMISGHANLFPVWAVLPSGTPEVPDARDFYHEAKHFGVKAFTAFPLLHNFSLSDWCLGDLLSVMEEARTPLLLPFSETNWQDIHELCTRHPRLPVIILNVNYRQLRYLLPLWRYHASLFVDLSWFSIVDIIPFLVEKKLSNRLIFGSHYPVYTPGAAITMVSYANVAGDIKKQIAEGNLNTLLQGVL